MGGPLAIEPFAIHVEDAVLADLGMRLRSTRWPDQVQDAGWEQGTERETLRSLVAYWADGFDWRAYERDLNGCHSSRRTSTDSGSTSSISGRRAGRAPDPPRQRLAEHLRRGAPARAAAHRPQAHGIAGPAFDVVIPSLPGYGFSDRSPRAGVTPRATAELFVELMRGLGYDRFVAHGSDFGAEVLTQLALFPPPHLAGLHLSTFDWRPSRRRVPIALAGRAPVPRRAGGLGRRRVRVRRASVDQAAEPRLRAERLPRRAGGMDAREVAVVERLPR